eukprot:CAMPEP_0206298522 /NCGR_PEP_ID=MMETSP0106_2-20121207/6729_1 /ASSEMBLY_ACC=CAM_ASM_000206 /TAXON_ID=81532 /ORGANISM="Acanthoeca-like sp., Strain 10tr" /LENGTH=162 /DNA_ID=CAMNT_0053729217 /DNA_START=312 /DNA_END=800 /DNA_ORIENTATION=+
MPPKDHVLSGKADASQRPCSEQSFHHVDARGNVADDPVHPCKELLPCHRRAAVDGPVVRLDLVQRQRFLDLVGAKCPWQVLLVRKNKQRRSRQPLFQEQSLQFIPAVLKAHSIRRVYNPDQPVGALKIIAPVRSKRFLPTNVPEIELEIAVLQRLDVEAKRG